MQIVGIEPSDTAQEGLRVHTIDVWFSERRRMWIVERLDEDGNQIGAAYTCPGEQDAATCLSEWLRTYDETYLVAPRATSAAERRILQGHPRSRAA